MHKNLKPTTSQRFSRWYTRAAVLGASVVGAASARATGEPLDLSTTGSTIAGYVTTAATAGVAVLAAIWGIKIIIKAFKSVAK